MLAPDHVVEGLLHHAYLFAEYLQHVWTDHKILPKQILLAAQQPAKGRVWLMAQLIERTAAASLKDSEGPDVLGQAQGGPCVCRLTAIVAANLLPSWT